VLHELGYGDTDIAQLHADGVVGAPAPEGEAP
jgi:hypothetical protein